MIRNLSFRNKLVLIVAPMMVALLVLLAAVARPRLAEATDARNSHERAVLADRALQVVNELDDERALTAQYLASRGQQGRDALVTQRTQTDRRIKEFNDFATGLPKAEKARPGRTEAMDAVASVVVIRKAVDTLNTADVTSTAEYSRRIERLIDLLANVTNESSNNELVNAGQSILFHVRAKEQISKQQAIIVGRLIRQQFNAADYVDFETLRNAEKSFFDLFKSRSVVDPDAIALQKTAEESPAFREANSIADRVSLAGRTGRVPAVGVADYFDRSQRKIDAVADVSSALITRFRDRTDEISSRARRLSLTFLLVGIVGVAAAFAAAVGLARSLVRRLDNLSRQAHAIATHRLPEVLVTLRRPTPEALAGALPQVQSDSNDEIGIMADSFNTVLRTSVENAIDHTERRAMTMTNLLVNLGRRNQGLIEKQLNLIDRLESTQHDPEVLDGLFKLDHMVTRMRRNAENLLVLAADAPARAWAEPVPVQDVFRGASSEVADLSRVSIELKPSDRSVVAGRHAVDLSHLIAELVDNAMLYSPPTTKVILRGERGSSQYRVWIVDHGVGMPEEDLREANQRLANPPDIDEMSADRVGFQVVGRIARRLGIAIRLVPNPTGGIAAEVSLPLDLFEADAPAPAPAPVAAAPVAPPAQERRPAPVRPSAPPPVPAREPLAAAGAPVSAALGIPALPTERRAVAGRDTTPTEPLLPNRAERPDVPGGAPPPAAPGRPAPVAYDDAPVRRARPDAPDAPAAADARPPVRRPDTGALTGGATSAGPVPGSAVPAARVEGLSAPDTGLPRRAAAPAAPIPPDPQGTRFAPAPAGAPTPQVPAPGTPLGRHAAAPGPVARRQSESAPSEVAPPVGGEVLARPAGPLAARPSGDGRAPEGGLPTRGADTAPSTSAPADGDARVGSVTAKGLQRRKPGASFAGSSATAEAFDGGLFRRLPSPGERPERSRRFGAPERNHEQPTGRAEDDAERRLHMLSTLKKGVAVGREQDSDAEENA